MSLTFDPPSLPLSPDDNRGLVKSSGGLPLLMSLAEHVSALPVEQSRVRLKAVLCGCVLNISNQNGTPEQSTWYMHVHGRMLI